MASGAAVSTSQFRSPAVVSAARSSMPTLSAPAASAASALAPWVNTATRTVLPVPWGSRVAPRTTWSDLRGSTPRLTATSTDSTNLTLDSSASSWAASSKLYTLVLSTFSLIAFWRLVSLAITHPPRSDPCYGRNPRWCVQLRPDRQRSDQPAWSWRSLPAERGYRYPLSGCSDERNRPSRLRPSSAERQQEYSWFQK